MSFESRLTYFRHCFFGLGGSSQKRTFLRAIRPDSGLPKFLIYECLTAWDRSVTVGGTTHFPVLND
jgi:hypothetical protein